jgi:ribosomal protein S18 acetylase RimI-like enzyme
MSPDAVVGCRRPRVMREDRPVALTVVELGSTELLGERRAELEQLWLDVWPGTSGRLYAILPGHARRAGFRFLAAQDGRRIVGFAYGYVGGEGEAWHERIARSMTEEQRERWLAPGELEFVELGVHPNRRRRGSADGCTTSYWRAPADGPPSSPPSMTTKPPSPSTSAAGGTRSCPKSGLASSTA